MDEAMFEFHGGLHLKDSLLWLDSLAPRPLCFVGHAMVPGAQGHHKIVSTAHTAELLRTQAAIFGRGRLVHEPQALITPYNRPFSLGQLSLELFPSGHILGSSSLLMKHRDLDIIYGSDVNLRSNALMESAEVRECDLLVLPCHFGQRRFVFPPQEEAASALVRFVSDALQRQATAVLFCSPLGEAQEVVHLLQQAGLSLHAHRQITMLCNVYREAGLPLEGVRRYEGGSEIPKVLLWPMRLRHSRTIQRLPQMRTAFISGLALDQEIVYQMSCDASFTISAHSDYGGLLDYIRACRPSRVVLVADATLDLEKDLSGLGVKVSSLAPAKQMDLF